jgi:hypothetical protein
VLVLKVYRKKRKKKRGLRADILYMTNRLPLAQFALSLCLLSFPFFSAPAQEEIASPVPEALRGVWEGGFDGEPKEFGGRIVGFYESGSEDPDAPPAGMFVFLKLFYGRYYDRTAEFPASAVRDRNDAAAKTGEALAVSFEETSPATQNSGSWTMRVSYPPYRESDAVALAVIGDNLYLNFHIRYDENPDSRNGIAGFWRAGGTASGITASRPYYARSVESFYITGGESPLGSVFRIRYWETDAEPDPSARAFFSDGENEYDVDKYIVIGDRTFTCVQGRGTRIRQITRSPLPENYELSDDGTLCAFGRPYLARSKIDDPYEEAARANAKRPPPPRPLFPPSNLDFHYDEIRELRKYTPNWEEKSENSR